MKTLKYILCLFCLLSFKALIAAHLVGGEISYQCLGNNSYEITMIVYRDCNSGGANFDNPAVISIYDGNNNLVQNLDVFITSQSSLPIQPPNNCTTLPLSLCTEKAVYKTTVYLPPIASGYVISHQRCCRNATISNITIPDTWGSTFTIQIPPNDSSCNSSPTFKSDPPVALCLDIPISLNASVTEIDGDSVSYALCELYHGGGQAQTAGALNSPAPDPAGPPPYTNVQFLPGFSSQNPITSNPAFSINSQTGILSGKPTQVGQYVFVICVTEYRNGQVLSTLRRDFQFNVTAGCDGTTAIIEGQDIDPSTLCSGRRVTFKQTSVNATEFFWDFGVPNISSDTSILSQPTYFYPDTGVYTVMLAINGSSSCSDTMYSTYRVYDSVNVQFVYNTDFCFDGHSIDFDLTGNYSSKADFYWHFGGATNIGFSSTLDTPSVVYDTPGKYEVSLTATDFECQSVFTDSVFIYSNPELLHYVPTEQGCAPLIVSFKDSSQYQTTGIHYWDFGDGKTSNDQSPTHFYEEEGIYTVKHTLIIVDGCKDTLSETFEETINVYPTPNSDIQLSENELSIYNPFLTITNNSSDHITTYTLLPDGQFITNLKETVIELPDTGTFLIVNYALNEYGCVDTAYAEVLVETPINFFIPTAFTPNNDGINDHFKYLISGVESHTFYIYNRWGELLFSSTDQNIAWDGKDYRSGKLVQGGVYNYVLIAKVASEGREEKITGSFVVIP